MALTGLAIAAALALAKNKMVDEPAANRQRKLAASTQAYSPWTHLKAQPVQDPNAIGQMLQYGATGAAMGSAIKGNNTAKDMKDASGAYSGINPYQDSGLYQNAPAWTNTNSPWPYRGAPSDSQVYYDWRNSL